MLFCIFLVKMILRCGFKKTKFGHGNELIFYAVNLDRDHGVSLELDTVETSFRRDRSVRPRLCNVLCFGKSGDFWCKMFFEQSKNRHRNLLTYFFATVKVSE